MIDPRPVTRNMLLEPVELRVDAIPLSYHEAKRASDARARESLSDPLLLAWFDKKAWIHSPALC